MIEFKNVTFTYENKSESVLSDINLSIKEGELILLTGVSGCGKTSLLRIINGLIPNFYRGTLRGQVTIAKKNILETSLRVISKLVSSVFQNPKSQFFNAIVKDELAFKSENYAYNPEKIEKKVQSTLRDGKMISFQNRNLFTMSGGEKQKISCLAVDVFDSDIIVMDEPSSNLDIRAIKDLMHKISKWKSEGKTIVIAEHRLSYLKSLVDKLVYLEKGRIKKIITRNELEGINECDMHSKGLRSLNETNFIDKEPIEYHANSIVIKDMELSFGKERILDISDVKIPCKSITAVIGLNGSGKSSFAKSFCGLFKNSKENIFISDNKLSKRKRLKDTYLVMQDVNHQLFTESVEEEMEISLAKKNSEKKYRVILESLNLIELLGEHPMSLSGGQKQRLAVATALASDRNIIIFDEPTSGLDYYHMQEVSRNILSLRQQGKTILIITHDPELIESCCDFIMYFESGKILWHGKKAGEANHRLNEFFSLASSLDDN